MSTTAIRSTPASSPGIPGATLGLNSSTTFELIHQLERGFPFRVLRNLKDASNIPLLEVVAVLGIPERTLARRRAARRFTPEESERLLRLSTVFEKAVALFDGDKSAASRWLTTPRRYFHNQSPWQYSRTEVGAREVENLIGRLEHGVVA